VWLSFRVGAKLFDLRVALAGASLLIVSPHFVWTCATLLSQPTLCLALLLGMLLVLNENDRPRTRNLLLAGFVFGFGILARPLPGALFALVAAASGYQEVHRRLGIFQNGQGEIVNSIFGGLLRENFWLLAWPFGLLLLPWCRPARAPVLYWGMLGAELAYRVVAPKTVVSVTGPTYLTEVVPLLTLGAADALQRIGGMIPAARVRPSVVAVAASVVGATMFVPIQAGALAVGSATRQVVFDELEKSGAERALIFSNAIVNPRSLVTWAYFPQNPSPHLDDPWIFVRIPREADPRPRMLDFWRRRFPDRRAFIFAIGKDGPMFKELNGP
jgi:hypothetical protein